MTTPSSPSPSTHSTAGARTTSSPRAATVAAASPVEVAQLAGMASEIGGVAGVMCAITLVGLAVGFVLLRVESAVEEGN